MKTYNTMSVTDFAAQWSLVAPSRSRYTRYTADNPNCPMNIPYALETAFAGVVTLAASASSLLLAQVDVAPTSQVIESAMELRMIMVPLIGGIIMMLGAVFLNPTIETNHVKVGRACFGVFAAVIAPQMIGWFHPTLKNVGTNPFMLLAVGGVAALLGFVFSRPAVHGIYNRSGRLAEKALDKAEQKYFNQAPSNKDPEP